MNVNEIFASIDGEGLRTGELATFIRLAGCNLRCGYCDTDYALRKNQGDYMDIDDIVAKVEDIGYRNVTLTGGEPLIHQGVSILINSLCVRGYKVNIETNGSRDISLYTDYENALITMDYKTSSSGQRGRMLLDNLKLLRDGDVLKFVVGSEEDKADVLRILGSYDVRSYVYLSPVFGKVEPVELVDLLKEMKEQGINTDKVRVQVQLHKIIWNPEERGV